MAFRVQRADGACHLAVISLGLISAVTASRPCVATAAERKPNIVLIVADDMGYAEAGVYGCKDIPTPHIDSLARNGVRFTQGYVSCPVCSPTRAGLMTGRYQQRFGHEFNPGPDQTSSDFRLPATETTLPERLKALGYTTGMIGKWHLGSVPESTPLRRGFDTFFGFLGGAHSYLRNERPGTILRGNEPVGEKEYLTDAFGREAATFIEKNKGRPFFLYLPFNAVHSPLQATEKYSDRFASIADEKRRTFAAMLAAMDDNIGRVLGKLREAGIEDNTLIVFHSDNGGPTAQTTSRNDPLRGVKGQVWEGGIRVPFIIQWKGRIPGGKTFDDPVIALDTLPTAVAAAGGRILPEWKLDGVNLLPYLTGEDKGKPHPTLYWRFGERYAVRHGDWKLVRETDTPRPALFNLARDVGEKNDLAAMMPEKVQELSELYAKWDAELAKPRWARRGARPDRGRSGQGNPSTAPAGRRGSLLDRFDKLDRNADGKLTPNEVPRAAVFRRADGDGDHVVTREEAKTLMRAPQRARQVGD